MLPRQLPRRARYDATMPPPTILRFAPPMPCRFRDAAFAADCFHVDFHMLMPRDALLPPPPPPPDDGARRSLPCPR